MPDDKIIPFPARLRAVPDERPTEGKRFIVAPPHRRGIRTFPGMWRGSNDDDGPKAA